MKRVLQGGEPAALARFRDQAPQSSWEQMRGDAQADGRSVYESIRAALIQSQRGLCAYCEIGISDNDPMKCRVEHFHPKSHQDPACNWALAWSNLLAVCNGGSHPHVTAPGFHLEPTADNLSCDAHKDHMIQQHLLTLPCEGAILDPRRLPAFPAFVRVHRGTGELQPDSPSCRACAPWADNRHDSVEELVAFTIRMLNLNCDRLLQMRLTLVRDIERQKKRLREAGQDAGSALAHLASRYFRPEWPAFFSTFRSCLGQAAEAHLQTLGYQG